jgi:CubicO group peptidase (beta-lactamase class C family)
MAKTADIPLTNYARITMKKLLFFFTLLPTLLFANVSASQGQDFPQADFDLQTLQQDMQTILAENKVPGAGFALIKDNKTVWTGALGYADIASQTTATADTVFRLGSQSKSFLGLGFMRLAQQGLVDLNTPILDIVPELQFKNPWRATDPVRIVHLLEHTAGFDDLHMNEFINTTDDPELPLEQVVAISPETRTVRWKPGSGKSYSNHGYLIAGYIMEKITGERYEDYLKRELLLPMGMLHSSARLSEVKDNLTTSYDTKQNVLPNYIALIRPAGSMSASPKDMELFLKTLLNRGTLNGNLILTPESVARFETPESFFALKKGLNLGYGLGVRPKFNLGYKGFGHRGGAPGMLGEYLYFSDLGIGLSISLNQMNDKALNALIERALSFLFTGIEAKQPLAEAEFSAQSMKQFEGYYQLNAQRMELLRFFNILLSGRTVMVKDGNVFIKEFMRDPVKMVPVSDYSFRKEGESEATVIFLTTDEGYVMADASTHYVQSSPWPSRVIIALLITTFIFMFSTLVYAIFWSSAHLYRKYRKNSVGNADKLIPRVMPLLATLTLFSGFGALSLHNAIVTLGQKNGMNISYLLASYGFAVLSIISIFTAIPYLKSKDGWFARWHTLLASISCFAFAGYMFYWGLVGLKLWDY